MSTTTFTILPSGNKSKYGEPMRCSILTRNLEPLSNKTSDSITIRISGKIAKDIQFTPEQAFGVMNVLKEYFKNDVRSTGEAFTGIELTYFNEVMKDDSSLRDLKATDKRPVEHR